MTKKKWITRLKKMCADAGTYAPYFDDVIKTLAAILDKRDAAEKQFEEEGSALMIIKIGSTGQESVVKNPIVQTIEDLDKDALAYWRDLGLTPQGLKKINDSALKSVKQDAFTDALTKLLD